MSPTQCLIQKVPKDHLFSILGDTQAGARDAHPSIDIDPRNGEATIVYADRHAARPFLVVLPTTEQREVLAQIGTFGGDLAPLSQWVRVVTSEWAKRLLEDSILPTQEDIAPAWVGAILGEVMARENVDSSDIPMSWVHATAGFTVARYCMLWGDVRPIDKTLGDIEEARMLLRADQRQSLDGITEIWAALACLGGDSKSARPRLQVDRCLMQAVEDVRNSGTLALSTIDTFAKEVPELKNLAVLDSIGPEDRVRLFDRLIGVLREQTQTGSGLARNILRFSLGYVVGRIGAGESNLGLLREIRAEHPATMVWGAALPALFRPYRWGKTFDGLGRLVVRDLLAPLHPKDAPTADISLDELRSTIDPGVAYKRLPFRTAQQGFALVEIAPSVHHAVRLQSAGQMPQQAIPARGNGQPELPIPSAKGEPGARSEFHEFLVDMKALLDRHIRHDQPTERASSSRYTKKKTYPR